MTTALVLVDLQADYFTDPGLGARRESVVEGCNRLVRAARARDLPVVEVRTVHAPDGSTWALNMLEDGSPLVLDGTPGAGPVGGLEAGDAVVVHKTRDSAFHRTALPSLLHAWHTDHVVLCGVSTESCVHATAVDAYAHDLRVTLVSDATASADEALHRRALEELAHLYRQEVVEVDDVRWGPVPH